jgi:hypothetical protein
VQSSLCFKEGPLAVLASTGFKGDKGRSRHLSQEVIMVIWPKIVVVGISISI